MEFSINTKCIESRKKWGRELRTSLSVIEGISREYGNYYNLIINMNDSNSGVSKFL